jgi:hypothetical protein
VDAAQSEGHAERIDGGVFVKRSCRGELCSRINQPLHDQRQSKIALTFRTIGQKLIKPDLVRHAQHRCDMSMWQRAQDRQLFCPQRLVAA